jgi:hypothetical protein
MNQNRKGRAFASKPAADGVADDDANEKTEKRKKKQSQQSNSAIIYRNPKDVPQWQEPATLNIVCDTTSIANKSINSVKALRDAEARQRRHDAESYFSNWTGSFSKNNKNNNATSNDGGKVKKRFSYVSNAKSSSYKLHIPRRR